MGGKKHQGKELQLGFWNVARSTNQPEMQKNLDVMSAMNGGEEAVKELLENWPITGWCVAFFSDIVKCDTIDNNMCETFNGVVLDARSKPIITMLEDIRQYVMTRLAVKRDHVLKWKCECGPNIVTKLDKERKKCGKWHVEWNGGSRHEVYWDNLILHVREAYVVTLAEHVRSCRKWSKSGIPCQHAIASIAFSGLEPLDFISEYFRKEYYLKAYHNVVNPVKGREFWPLSEERTLLPPMVRRMPGRPAKKRKREPLEDKNKGRLKISRRGRVFKCSLCLAEGHNKLTCPQKKSTGGSTEHPQDVDISSVDTTANVASSQASHRGHFAAKRKQQKTATAIAPRPRRKITPNPAAPTHGLSEQIGQECLFRTNGKKTLAAENSAQTNIVTDGGRNQNKEFALKGKQDAPKGSTSTTLPHPTSGNIQILKGRYSGGFIIGRYSMSGRVSGSQNSTATAVNTAQEAQAALGTQQSMTIDAVKKNP
ncbi:uncharacterized protein LOC120254310 [Dioscorea cayenensis subsp. rotundata]|uniref:Uncharacterized protein LOC120254310 n=1 Tax=Dioscorea cayennensis subsp. rotundata TaxID=55577 RepID=A0AB40AVP3_DIOCR|nr:uncharacterized protein LOC120254310 [Dioscorea cayenensis subsp. rotundata]